MLLSMTGHGESRLERNGASIAVEVRTLNNRYFKLTVRAGEGYAPWEPRIEAVVRQCVRRGTVQVSVRVDREVTPDRYQLHTAVLAGYLRQLEGLSDQLNLETTIRLEPLLALPGVVDERVTESADLEADWPLMEETLQLALSSLDDMRREEGRVMTADLQGNCQSILVELEQISRRAPLVADVYRARLTERLNRLLHDYDQRVEPSDIVREVGTFAERSDISEELVRLGSHIEQFLKFAELPESSGRKLDFLTQEMFREANTIGSKANDADIASHVVEIKVLIERMREMIQNVE